MLILSRKGGQSLQISEDIEIKIVQTGKGHAKIDIEAPRSLLVLRKELIMQIRDGNLHSVAQNEIKLDDLSKKLKQRKHT